MDKKRVDGLDGWKKGACAWSKTWFAWQQWNGEKYVCTCEPCPAPDPDRGKGEKMKIYHVTEVLGKYMDWSSIPDQVLEHACRRGSWVHRACEAVALDYYFERKRSDNFGLYVKSFQKWFDITVDGVLAVEKEITCKALGFKGRLDFLFVFKTGEHVLVDIKTPVALLKTWACQLSAYEYLLSTEGFSVDAVMSLRLKADGGAALGKRYLNVAQDFAVFTSALNAHRSLT